MTDQRPVVSDELVEKAAELLWASWPDGNVPWAETRPGNYGNAANRCRSEARWIMEAVLPDIERPWQKKVAQLELEVELRSEEYNRAVRAEAAFVERDAKRELLNVEIRRLDLVILKRDREIDRLNVELDEEVAHWKRQLAAMDEAAAELRSHRDELKAQLVERDKEIKELKADLFLANVPLVRIDEFSDAEREKVSQVISWWCRGRPKHHYPELESARAKLEQGQ